MIKVNDFVLNTSVEDIIRTLRTSLHEEKIDLLRYLEQKFLSTVIL